jgi:hypothetical protein
VSTWPLLSRRTPLTRARVATHGALAMLLAALATFAVPLTPRRTGAQQDGRASLPPAVDALVDSARRAGLPVEPLLDKAREGRAKGVADGAVVQAVRALRDRLSTAREALGAGARTSELDAGAAALAQGVSPSSLAALRAARPSASLAGPLIVLRLGIAPQRAVALVGALARGGADDAAFLALGRRVRQDVAAGSSPTDAAATHARGLLRTAPSTIRGMGVERIQRATTEP